MQLRIDRSRRWAVGRGVSRLSDSHLVDSPLHQITGHL